MQVNPPFDGSPPCPMCSTEVRSVSASVHNFLVWWPEPKALHKLHDLALGDPAKIATDHPVVRRLLDTAQRLVDAYRAFQKATEGKGGTWADVKDIDAIVPDLRAASVEIEPLSQAHFHDYRHSHGDPNILRERQGYTSSLDGTGRQYHETVEVVPAGGDLAHQPCGTRLKLGETFKADLARDPAFYGLVFCPTCRLNAPFAQYLRTM
jgi:hypothetical protein